MFVFSWSGSFESRGEFHLFCEDVICRVDLEDNNDVSKLMVHGFYLWNLYYVSCSNSFLKKDFTCKIV